ncbi:hypothetical protein PsorP6_004653 [Peronosclerospora sorghi]|uniref:Uncharacterized protein n=1 Tax=Peronosclerospora sorghi TaxID=230839 RepID=A0ACC0VJK1_9STRA|nr:hypothetical protein PsorP6_004653 [Peronosclerospora sorghi]
MARTKSAGNKHFSTEIDVVKKGRKVAIEKKKTKNKMKAKGRAKFAAKVAKEEKKRLVKEASHSETLKELDDGFIELNPEDDDDQKILKQKKEDQDKKTHAIMLETRPWMRDRKGYFNKNVYECLHEEIMEFLSFVSPTDKELTNRSNLIDEMQEIVKGLWPGATVETFGSHYTQMFLPHSDIDMVLFGVPEGKEPLFKLAECLEEKDLVSYLEVIDKARIPIVKMVHKASDIHVDVSFNVAGGLATGDLVRHYMRVYPPFRPLTLVLKYFMAQRGLNETYSGGVGSFLLQMMVVSYLQHHGRSLGADHDNPKFNNLGNLLLGFFTLYGHDFNYTDLGISVRNGGSYFYKEDRRWYDAGRPYLIAMENPNEPSLDIGKNSYEIRTVKRSFEYARQILLNEIHRHGQFNKLSGSILGAIIPADGNLVKRDPPHSFGYDILHHDPEMTAKLRQQYERRRAEESNKRSVESAKKFRITDSNELPHKRWKGRSSRIY